MVSPTPLPEIPSADDILVAARAKGLGPYQLCLQAGVSRSAFYKACVEKTALSARSLRKLIKIINKHEDLPVD